MVPLKTLKAFIKAVPADELPLLLTEVIRQCIAKKAIGGRSISEFAATIEEQVKGL